MLPAAALPLALAAALLVAGPAQSQAQKVFRCVDQNGKTYYTEQPGASCKQVRIDVPAAPPPAAKKAPVPSKAVAKRSAPAALTREAHCSGLVREAIRIDQGKGGSGADAGATAQRRAGIQRALEDCPQS